MSLRPASPQPADIHPYASQSVARKAARKNAHRPPVHPGEIGPSFLDKQDSLRRPRSPLRLGPQPPPWPGNKACAPTDEASVAPKAELGTSRAMLQTSLSAKKSSPVNCRLFFAPSTSAEERVAYASRQKEEAIITCLGHPRLPPC